VSVMVARLRRISDGGQYVSNDNKQSLRQTSPCTSFSIRNCKLSHEGAQISYRNAVLYLEAKTKADKYL
jgi:hypothetical protein